MKKLILVPTAVYAAAQMAVMADIVVPGADGSDCDLVITENTVIDLSLATTAAWNANYNVLAAADPNRVATDFIGKGVYDAEKWAVVFRYTHVTIAAGATVTFKNHPSRAPVVWLVSGAVDISGTLSLNGEGIVDAPLLSEPGPGGFRGGSGSHFEYVPYLISRFAGDGFGPGGGNETNEPNSFGAGFGFGGSYSTVSSTRPDSRGSVYGNASLLPLIGGSGGSAIRQGEISSEISDSGAAGGGAVLIAAQAEVEIAGVVSANGGAGSFGTFDASGGGSGGGVRIVCSTLSGNGSVLAVGGTAKGPGGLGRIRFEREIIDNGLIVNPAVSSVLLGSGDVAQIWPPDSAPFAKLVSFGGTAAPSDPRAEFKNGLGPDMVVGNLPVSQAVIETTNLPINGQVQVRITPLYESQFSAVDAVFDSQISADPLVLRWLADVPITGGYSAIQVRIVAP